MCEKFPLMDGQINCFSEWLVYVQSEKCVSYKWSVKAWRV